MFSALFLQQQKQQHRQNQNHLVLFLPHRERTLYRLADSWKRTSLNHRAASDEGGSSFVAEPEWNCPVNICKMVYHPIIHDTCMNLVQCELTLSARISPFLLTSNTTCQPNHHHCYHCCCCRRYHRHRFIHTANFLSFINLCMIHTDKVTETKRPSTFSP